MEKNYLSSVVAIVLAAVLVLLGLYWLPAINVGDWSMRKVDLLADVRNDSALHLLDSISSVKMNGSSPAGMAKTDSASNLPVLEGSRLTRDKHGNVITVEDSIINAKAEVTVTRSGITSIIDLGDDTGRGNMTAFYQALAQAAGRPVRIAVLGDSFIEGDILTSKLRELLQQRFGGCGVGYLPMTSITADFRRTVKQTFGGWTPHKAVDRSGYGDTYNNITGNYFNAGPGAWVMAKGIGNPYQHAASCTSSSFYFVSGTGSCYATAVVNGTDTTHFNLQSSSLIGHAVVQGDIKQVKWTVSNPGNMVFLGTSMDCDRGVIVDNLSLRASRGNHLSKITGSMMSAFNQVRHYDLVIIMYGLNIAGHNSSAYTAYCNTLTAAINNIKNTMPGTSVLVVGCSDREERTASGWKTMPGVLGLIQAQKRVAINSRVAFWDLYEAMGGEGSIVNMVRNGEANSDYTHITHRGGDRIARYLYDALMLGFETR